MAVVPMGTGITWGSVTINSSAPSGSGTIDKGYFNFNHDVFHTITVIIMEIGVFT